MLLQAFGSRASVRCGVLVCSLVCALAASRLAGDGGAGQSDAPLRAVRDEAGRLVDPFARASDSGTALTVLFFVAPDCPISNRYAPEIARLHEAFGAAGITTWLVYVEASVAAGEVASHRQAHALDVPVLFDPQHELVGRARVEVTPEAAVFAGRRLVYSGRIDDRVVDFGRTRPAPTQHDLREAVSAALAGRPVARPRVPGVGCVIGPPADAAAVR